MFTFFNLINFHLSLCIFLAAMELSDFDLYHCLSKTKILANFTISFHLFHLWNSIRLSAPIIKKISNVLFIFFKKLIKSMVFFELILCSRNSILINLSFFVIFFEILILSSILILGSFLNGFFWVMDQII